MNKYAYIAALALCGSAFAQQNQNPNPNPNQPGQTQPSQPQSAADRAAQGISNTFKNWRQEDLPAPVQKTVREQAAGQPIADIDREDRTGQTIWEVEFERDGKNPKIHVTNDGKLLSEQEYAQLNKNYGVGAPGVGSPAGAQTGRTRAGVGTQWQDLPQPVQQKAMQFGGKEKAKDIDLKHRNGRNVYAMEFERDGRNLEVTFAEDGTILKSNDHTAAPAQGSAAGSEAGRGRSYQQPGQSQPAQQSPRTDQKQSPNP